jgi:hypothetical protein
MSTGVEANEMDELTMVDASSSVESFLILAKLRHFFPSSLPSHSALDAAYILNILKVVSCCRREGHAETGWRARRQNQAGGLR